MNKLLLIFCVWIYLVLSTFNCVLTCCVAFHNLGYSLRDNEVIASRIVLDCDKWTNLANSGSWLWMEIISSLVKIGLSRISWISILNELTFKVKICLSHIEQQGRIA